MTTATIHRADLAPVEASVARYYRETAGAQISEDIGLAPSNVSRRFSSVLRSDRIVDAFTGRHVLSMLVADHRRGGDLLDQVRRAADGAPTGDPAAAAASADELARHGVALAHAVAEAKADGVITDEESAAITDLSRKLMLAANGGCLANLDALAQRGAK